MPDRVAAPARRCLIAGLAGSLLLAPAARQPLAQPQARAPAKPPVPAGTPALDRDHGADLLGAPALSTLDGAPLPLQRYLGRPLLLNFWATWCGPCVAEMPALAALRNAQGPGGSGRIEVVAVNAGQSINQVEQFLVQRSLQLPIVIDAQKLALARWQVRLLPTTLLFDAAGRLRANWTGARDWASAAMARELDRALGDDAPRRAFGDRADSDDAPRRPQTRRAGS